MKEISTMTKLIQRGLYSKTKEDLEAFADRVSDFNKEKGFVVVEMEGRESPPDEHYGKDHWKIELQFKTRAYANAFWTDPKYQRKVLV